MKKILTCTIVLLLAISFFACANQSIIVSNPPNAVEWMPSGSEGPPYFTILSDFYLFMSGERNWHSFDSPVSFPPHIMPNAKMTAPLIRLEDILPETTNELFSVELWGSFVYAYRLHSGVEIIVRYIPDFDNIIEPYCPVQNYSQDISTLRIGDVFVTIRMPSLPERIPSWLEHIEPDRVDAMLEISEERFLAAQEQLSAIFTDPVYLPITAVRMFDQAWVESAVETLDFMTEELATQLQAEISEAARANVPSPADMLMANIRANMVWPR